MGIDVELQRISAILDGDFCPESGPSPDVSNEELNQLFESFPDSDPAGKESFLKCGSQSSRHGAVVNESD